MNANFSACIGFVLHEEGGYTDNPQDPGGPTNFGITLQTLTAWRRCPCSATDVQRMHQGEAITIYTAEYWHAVRADDLPSGLDLMVFDAAVNMGVETASRLLQHILGVAEDGLIGPMTLHAAACTGLVLRTRIANYARCQNAHYQALPDFPVFGRGWTARMVACQAAAIRLALLPPHPSGAVA